MKEKLFTVLQIGDRSNHISRLFDIFITITIFANIIVTFMETFEELSGFSSVFRIVEIVISSFSVWNISCASLFAAHRRIERYHNHENIPETGAI